MLKSQSKFIRTGLNLFVLIFLSLASVAEARRNNDKGFKGPDEVINDLREKYTSEGKNPGQKKETLSEAIRNRRDMHFAEGTKLIVVKLMQDDNSGLKHQRWYVKTADGATVFAVYNIDFSERVPLELGQTMDMGGEFKMTNQGPLLHWLHEDPKGKRPDGYVDLNGHRYGKEM